MKNTIENDVKNELRKLSHSVQEFLGMFESISSGELGESVTISDERSMLQELHAAKRAVRKAARNLYMHVPVDALRTELAKVRARRGSSREMLEDMIAECERYGVESYSEIELDSEPRNS